MIESSLESSPCPHIRHEVVGPVPVSELALTFEHATQHDQIPILWDLTRMDDQALRVFARWLGPFVASHVPDTCSKRALILTVAQQERAAALLASVGTRCWAVFGEREAALTWFRQTAPRVACAHPS